MKRLLWIMPMVASIALCAPQAHAQNSDDLAAQIQAFKKARSAGSKEDASKSDAENAAGDKAKEEVVTDPLAELRRAAEAGGSAAPAGTPAASPLGPAANLPVVGGAGADGALLGGALSPEDVQAQMEAEQAEQKRKIREETFKNAMEGLLPLSPDEIRRLLGTFKDSREASETPIANPEPRSVVETISLDPSVAPSVIKTAPGMVTTVSILDQTGAPWAIQDVSWAGKYDVDTPEEGGNVLRITPKTAHGIGNISIRLVDLVTPVILSLQTGLDEVYYRYDGRIPKQGPLAKTPLIEYGGLKAVAGSDANLANVLDGTITADEASKLKLDGVDGRTTAWKIDDVMYLRTPLTLLSPAWDSSASSADGMNVYTLNEVPVVLLSDKGKMVRAHVLADE